MVPKDLIWVDPATNTLTYDGNLAISTTVVDLNLKIQFEDDWAEYVKGEEWDKLVKDSCWGLDKKRDQSNKGKGTGPGTDASRAKKKRKGPE